MSAPWVLLSLHIHHMLLTLHPAYICLASACDWNQRETSGSIPLTIGFESTGHVRQNSARAGHQLFPGDLQTKNDLLSAEWCLSSGIFLHIWTPSTDCLKSCAVRERKESFKGFAGFLMANIKQNGWCFTNTPRNGEREVGSSAMATTAAVCTVIYVADSSVDYVTEQAMRESKGNPKPFLTSAQYFQL